MEVTEQDIKISLHVSGHSSKFKQVGGGGGGGDLHESNFLLANLITTFHYNGHRDMCLPIMQIMPSAIL